MNVLNILRFIVSTLVGLGIGNALVTMFDAWTDRRKAGRHA